MIQEDRFSTTEEVPWSPKQRLSTIHFSQLIRIALPTYFKNAGQMDSTVLSVIDTKKKSPQRIQWYVDIAENRAPSQRALSCTVVKKTFLNGCRLQHNFVFQKME
jgi:hypothetical protein